MIKDRIKTAATLAASWLPDALMVAGAGGVSYGAWLVYAPTGFIIGGALTLAAGVLAARKGGA